MRIYPISATLTCLALIFSSTFLQAQSSTSPTLLTFKQEAVSKAEFERVYQKNNGGYDAARAHTSKQYEEYLELYINFKRKVFEAEAQGLNETESFKKEFDSYRKQLAQPYLAAKEVEDRLIQEAYDRSAYVVKASHLLISVSEDASPADTLKAYTRIMTLRDSIVKNNAPFARIAENNSQDPSAKQNKGNLGYFSVFDMVYPFETAAFQTPAGEVSKPIRTRFGYHLVQVNQKLNIPGKKRAAHIIIRVGDRYAAKDSLQAEKMINELYERLEAGEEFAKLAQDYSDDPNSKGKGGDLGSSRLLPEMEELKYQLGAGEYSKPFTTAFGWHIMTVTEIDSLQSFDEAKARLRQRIQRDARSRLSREAMLNRIKKENKYEAFDDNFEAFKQGLDQNFPKGSWEPDFDHPEQYEKPLFSLGDDYEKSVRDFVDFYLSSRIRRPNLSAEKAADAVYQTYLEKELLKYEELQLPKKNPEFKHLLREYRDGILLFTLMEQKVWKKAVEDSVGLKAYYEAHQDSFEADVILDVLEYRSKDKAIIEQAEKLLKGGSSEAYIDSISNQNSSLTLRITRQSYEKGKSSVDNKFFSKKVGTQSNILSENGFYKILIIEEKFPAGIKPFDKAKSECITKYQDYLEKNWLKELEKKYPVKVDKKVFAQLFN